MHHLVLVALGATIALVCAQGGTGANGGFSSGGSFEADEKYRFSLRLKFVSRASCGCASAGNPSGDFDGCSGSGSGSVSGGGSGAPGFPTTPLPGITGPSGSTPSSPAVPSGSTPSGELPEPSGEWPSGLPSGLPAVCYGPSGSGSGDEASGSGDEGASGSGSGDEGASGSGSVSGSGSGGFTPVGECQTSGEYASHNGGWFEGDLCLFLQILFEWSYELSGSDQVEFQAWIKWAQINIIQSSTYTSDEERFSAITSACFFYLSEHTTIKEKFQWKYLEIDSFSWGFLQFLQSAQYDAVVSGSFSVTIEQSITVTNGQNLLTKACDEWAGSDSGKIAAAQWFKGKVIAICSAGGSTQSILIQLEAVFEQFESLYASYSESFFSYQISGFCEFDAFRGYCKRAKRVHDLPSAIGGSADTCPLLLAIQSIYNTQSYSVSFRSQVKQWYTALYQFFSSTSDVTSRVNFWSNETYQFFLENNWNESIIFNQNITVTYSNGTTIEYGTFYDFLDAIFGFSSGQLTFPSSSQSTTTIAATTTTIRATTTTPAITTTTTSAGGTGQCSSVFQCNVASQNTTWVLTTISNANQTQMTRSQWNQFQGYYKHLSQVAGSGGNQTYVLTQSQTTLNNFASASSALYQLIHNLTIVNWGGTIDQYCKCPTPSS